MQREKQDTWPIGLDRQPTGVDEAAFIAANATLIGDVHLSEAVSIWYGAILRGDLSPIVIGRRSNIQDGAILHGDPGQPTLVGEEVTVGHRAVIHSAHIEGGCLIGIGAIILNGVTIGAGSMVGAGAVVTRSVPPRSLAAGIPAKVIRTLTEEEVEQLRLHAQHYVDLALQHASRFGRWSRGSGERL
ncbi:gamma carbonic anhydrase family protein [Thermostichus sp. MS-CIW-41]|jgi:carbonic anhydrase/acetyltransferase-like protein (isoleucine patch superfamily)